MKFTTFATVCLGAAQAHAAQYTDYFFRYAGGNDLLNGLRLRGNNSIDFYSPGVTQPPYNPEDHFNRLTTNATLCTPQPQTILLVVPTKPHPPPVPGYYGLSDLEGVPDAYRLVYTYRLDDAGAGFGFRGWRLQKKKGGAVVLRYEGKEGKEGWKWIAVREASQPGDVEKWVPWFVKRSDANAATLAGWEIEEVDLELVEAKGPVNSQAPGGVEE